MWVSPFLACATGRAAAATAMTQVASDPATVVHFTAGPLLDGSAANEASMTLRAFAGPVADFVVLCRVLVSARDIRVRTGVN
ncbi:hypothetical protein MMAN_32070 [Mycobacterium mantenii]|uniref:Secreted protein n=1 Tax=Mycobacterium mantenii TaxID=560555 RepID=A0ABN6ABG4_MYCNT|nr:hypothetical protein MMAN_32070 [Mycobacterium mantenii]